MGQVQGLIPMRLGNLDFNDLDGLWPYCAWKEAFKPCCLPGLSTWLSYWLGLQNTTERLVISARC